MTAKPLPPQDVLRQLLRYEPDSGKLFWRERGIQNFATVGAYKMWNTLFSETEAGTTTQSGYLAISVWGTSYSAHRVIYKIHYGADPAAGIDHVDGNPLNNRIENLRPADQQVNNRNMAMFKTNSSGVVGVNWHKRDRRWRAFISVGDKSVHLGNFVNLDDAIAARQAAEIAYGFHANHGRLTPLTQ